ncbi:PspC domain-containing protein [Candidatus Uhrbacteria bacterium]|nr:PspC domain-containing protein [Candidatus Uhrbacteria bacterium]
MTWWELRPFRLIDDASWIGGVCAGFAYAIGVPVWSVRLLWGASLLFLGVGFLPYCLLWVLASDWESDPSDFYERTTGVSSTE